MSGIGIFTIHLLHVTEHIFLCYNTQKTSASEKKNKKNSIIKWITQAELSIYVYPLCVTRTWRKPSFLNMSMTVSIGVWSVTVMGAKSKMRLSFKGVEPCHGDGMLGVNKTKESSPNPSWVRLALAK